MLAGASRRMTPSGVVTNAETYTPSVTQYRLRSTRPTKKPSLFSAGPSADGGIGAKSGRVGVLWVVGADVTGPPGMPGRPCGRASFRDGCRFGPVQVRDRHRIPVNRRRRTSSHLAR